MVDKIAVEIGLDGGAEVAQQLENIGKAGQQAFGDIQNAADQVNLESATDEFKNLGNAGVTAFNKVQQAAQSAVISEHIIQGVKKVEGAFESLGNAAAKLGTRLTRGLGPLGVVARALGPVGIALGVAGGAFVKFGNDAADSLNKLTTQGAKLDLTAQQFDRLRQALGQSGISSDALSGLEKLKETLAQDFFPTDVITGLQRFIAQLERMPDSVARTQLAIQTLGENLGGQVIAGLQTGAISAQNFAAALGQVTPATQQQIQQAAAYEQALNRLSAAWTQLKMLLTPITTPILDFLTNEIKALTQDIQNLISQVTALWNFLSALGGVFSAQGPDEMAAAVRRLSDAFAQLATTMTAVSQAAPKGGFQPWTGGDASQAGFAGGGQVGGRGSGTSDSNLAWVSRGEHIMPARAVAQPGVLHFLEALRRSGGNLRGVLDGMGRFALGGLVPRPAFATGGQVGSMSHVTINFPGVPPVSGLRASVAVVDQLQKAAALAQVRSGGRKPSRYS